MDLLQTMKAFRTAGQQVSQIRNMMNLVKNSGNPQAMLNQMAMSNPQVKEAMDYINKYNGDGEKAFYALAKEKNQNPEEILKQLL